MTTEKDIHVLSPEWKVWATCPHKKCKSVGHACCRQHLRETLEEHYNLVHDHDFGVLPEGEIY